MVAALAALILGAADVPPTSPNMWLGDVVGITCSVTRTFETPDTHVRFTLWQRLSDPKPFVILKKLTPGETIDAQSGSVTRDEAPGTDIASIERAGNTALSAMFGYRVTLDRSMFEPAAAKLAACLEKLPAKWGVPLPLRFVPPPKDSSGWLDRSAYVSLYDRTQAKGRVDILVTFDAAGDPASCRPILLSGFPELDKIACEGALEHGKIAPGAPGRFMVIMEIWNPANFR